MSGTGAGVTPGHGSCQPVLIQDSAAFHSVAFLTSLVTNLIKALIEQR